MLRQFKSFFWKWKIKNQEVKVIEKKIKVRKLWQLSAIIICTFQCMIEVWFNVMKDGKRGMTNTNCPYHIHFRTFYLKVNILGRTWSWELYKVQCTSISEYTRELLRSELFLLISTWSFLSLQSTKTVKANTAKIR